MLAELEATPKDQFGKVPEDLRSFAAKEVLPAAYRSGVSLERIQQAALQLASTGDYPFDGIGKVIRLLEPREQEAEIRTLVHEAASNFKPVFRSEESIRDYAYFLTETWGQLGRTERLSALSPFLASLERMAANEEDHTLGKQVLTGDDPATSRAYARFLLQSCRIETASLPEPVLERWRKLQHNLRAGGEVSNGPDALSHVSVRVGSKPSASAIAEASGRVSERGELLWIRSNGSAEPRLLLNHLALIASPELRYEAIQTILVSERLNRETRESLEQEAKRTESQKNSPMVRLRILRTKILNSKACETEEHRALVKSAIVTAEELFRLGYEGSSSRPAYAQPGFGESMEILKANQKCDPYAANQVAQAIQHPVLKAYALVLTARPSGGPAKEQ